MDVSTSTGASIRSSVSPPRPTAARTPPTLCPIPLRLRHRRPRRRLRHRRSRSEPTATATASPTTWRCTLIANADQRDTNGDGYGNLCDADLNNDTGKSISATSRRSRRCSLIPVTSPSQRRRLGQFRRSGVAQERLPRPARARRAEPDGNGTQRRDVGLRNSRPAVGGAGHRGRPAIPGDNDDAEPSTFKSHCLRGG